MPGFEKVFVLGKNVPGNLRPSGLVIRLRGQQAIHTAVFSVACDLASVWVAADQESADELLKEVVERNLECSIPGKRLGTLALLETPRLKILAPAQELFSRVAWADAPNHWLPLRELTEIFYVDDPRSYVVGGTVDLPTKILTLIRGDFDPLTVPLSIFKPTGAGVTPDPTDFEVIDGGQAIRLGEYEALAESIFYEADPDYRRRIRARMRAEEKTFGASLRRLRLQRGLRQEDFTPLAKKTISRIESGKNKKPHWRTLNIIANRLGVSPDEIDSY